MRLPAVSIVVPTYDRAELLPVALDSVLAQEGPRTELIVVDDGSTDGTPEVLAAYAREVGPDQFRTAVVSHGGQVPALNHGFTMARGEVLGTLASDDALTPGAIRVLVEELDRHPEAVAAYGDNNLIDAEGRVFDVFRAYNHTAPLAVSLQTSALGVGVLFRREVYDVLGGWNPNTRYLPDFEYWIRAALLGAFHKVPGIVGLLRVHPGAITHAERGLAMARERLALLDRLLADPHVAPHLEAVRSTAYRNAFFSGGLDIAPDEVNRPGERFFVDDTFAARMTQLGVDRRASELTSYQGALADAERRLQEQDAAIRALTEAVAERDDQLDEANATQYPPA